MGESWGVGRLEEVEWIVVGGRAVSSVAIGHCSGATSSGSAFDGIIVGGGGAAGGGWAVTRATAGVVQVIAD